MTGARPISVPHGTYSSSFILPITRDGFALLSKTERVVSGAPQTKFALIGGKPMECEDAYMCAGRKMHEETGGSLSFVTRARVKRGAGMGAIVHYVCPNAKIDSRCMAMMHDLVVDEDRDVDQRFDLNAAQRLAAMSLKSHTAQRSAIQKRSRKGPKKSTSLQVGLQFVPVNDIKCNEWRKGHMFTFPHAVLVSRLMNKAVFDAGLPLAWKVSE